MTGPQFRTTDLDRLDDASRHVMDLAREEGRFFQQDYVGTEHMLAALLRSRDPVVTSVLRSFEVGIDDVRTTLHTIIASGLMPEPRPREVLTRRAKRVLDVARAHADGDPVQPTHLLLGLLEEGGGVAAVILTALDVDLVDLRARLLERLGSA